MFRFLFFTLFAAGAVAHAESITFPADAGVFDVTKAPYEAKGDGVTDNTAILQRAISEHRRKFHTLYFPNGTYLVKDKLMLGNERDARQIIFQGQSKTGAIIKLADNAAGFDDPAKPKPLFTMIEGGHQGQAFHNELFNLCFDTGKGNPGAIGLVFQANNQGAAVDILIRSSDGQGFAGFDASQPQPGPALIKNLTVEGFRRGVNVTRTGEYSLTFENLTLSGQSEAGIWCASQPLAIRRLKSQNSVPAIVQTNAGGLIALVDSEMSGGDAKNPAIRNAGQLFLRNLKQTGYGQFVDNQIAGVEDVAGQTISEWASRPAKMLFPVAAKSLDLPIEDTPEIPFDDPATWVKVEPGTSAQIQAAFDRAAREGKTTVYFPARSENAKSYTIEKTIRVHGSVRRVMGMDTTLNVTAPLLFSSDAVFRFENLTAPAVVFERFFGLPWAPQDIGERQKQENFVWFEHAFPSALVISHAAVGAARAYRSRGGGKAFFEDITGQGCEFEPGQKAFFRQFNPEHYFMPGVVNDGADVVILGLKTEGYLPAVETINGGRTDILGGLLYPAWRRRAYEPEGAFLVNNGSLSFALCGSNFTEGNMYPVLVRETQNGETHQLKHSEAGSSGRSAFNIPLFVSRVQNPNAPRVAASSWTVPDYFVVKPPVTLGQALANPNGALVAGEMVVLKGQNLKVAAVVNGVVFLAPTR